MHSRSRFLRAGLLTLVAFSSVSAQSDTIAPRPLFTWADASLAGLFVVGTIAVRPFDRSYAQRLQRPANQDNKFYGQTATVVRDIAVPGAYIIGPGMYLVGRVTHHERVADLGWHGTEAVLVGSAVSSLVKGIAGRGRPYLTPPPEGPDPNNYKLFRGFGHNDAYRSFPSGHATAAFSAAAAVTNEMSRWWPQGKWVVGTAMYGGATLVGLSRMYQNRHWASDVLVGAAIGTFAGNKVVRYHHSHPGSGLDKWILSASLVPDGNGGMTLGWSVVPGSGLLGR